MDRGAWRATDHGVTESRTRLSTHTQHTRSLTKTLLCLTLKATVILKSIFPFFAILSSQTIKEYQKALDSKSWKLMITLSISKVIQFSSVQFSSVAQSCPTLCDPMDCSTPGFPVHHQLLELAQTHIHWVGDAIQPSHPLSSPSPPAFNLSQHQSLFKWVSSSHQVAKVLEFQLQHQSFQWTPRTDLL